MAEPRERSTDTTGPRAASRPNSPPRAQPQRSPHPASPVGAHGSASAAAESQVFSFAQSGPPPDIQRRRLIFDSLSKIVASSPTKEQRSGAHNDTRGTHVFTWGAGYHGQLGRRFVRGQKKYSAVPRLVELNVVVRQITCGALHTAIVTEGGQVYTWGDGRQGQLGHSAESFTIQPVPILVEGLASVFVVQVACGRSHTVALSDKGSLYSWGWSKFGQTGHGDRQLAKQPKLIECERKDFAFVAAGDKHTIAVTKSGHVFSFGCNEHGQIGQGLAADVLKPTLIEPLAAEPMRSAACGNIHSAILSATGEVYVCGFGEHFFADDSEHFYVTPKKVEGLREPVKQLACGQSHVIALAESGDVYAWGGGEYGQIGYGVRGNLSQPRLIMRGKGIVSVAAGRYHSFALTNFGVMYSWGCGESGQLGHDNDENLSLPKVVETILGTVVGHVACGEHHTAVISAAPWTKISADMVEWLKIARETRARIVQHLKTTNRGLAPKDHQKLEEEMAAWVAEYESQKQKQLQEEEKETQRDVEAIRGKDALLEDVLRDLAANRAAALPSSPEAVAGLPSSFTELALPSTHAAGEQPGQQSPQQLPPPPPSQQQQQQQQQQPHPHQQQQVQLQSQTQPQPQAQQPDTLDRRASVRLHEQDRHTVSANGLPSPAALAAAAAAPQGGAHVAVVTSGPASARMPAGRGRNQSAPYPQPPATARSRSKSGGPASTTSGARDRSGSTTLSTNAQLARNLFLKESAQGMLRMTKIVVQKGASETNAQLARLNASVCALRKEYDLLRSSAAEKAESLSRLEREHEALNTNSAGMQKQSEENARRLRALEMQLDTVTIKITETEENRKNYELNIAHLKEEEFEHFNELEALRKQCHEINAFYRKMNELKIHAFEEKDRAEGEVQQFRNEVQSYQRFVGQQLAQFSHVLESVHKQNSTRAHEKEERASQAEARVRARVEELAGQAEQGDEEAQRLASQLHGLESRLRHYESRFQAIVAATGLSDPQAIINKFTFKGEIKEQLSSEIEGKKRALEDISYRRQRLEQELQDAKRGFRDRKWRDVDQLEDTLREATVRVARSQSEVETAAQRIAFVQEGLLNLLRAVNDANDRRRGAPADTASAEAAKELNSLWSPEQCAVLLRRTEAALEELARSQAAASAGRPIGLANS